MSTGAMIEHIAGQAILPLWSIFAWFCLYSDKLRSTLTEAFFCGKTMGYESVTIGAHFESVFLLHFGGFEKTFRLAMPCEASSQTVFSNTRIE